MTDKRERTRDAFVRGDEGLEPSMERLLAATPELVREAGRRRAVREAGPPLLALLVSLAFRAIPRLGAFAALLLAVATTTFLVGGTAETTTTASAASSVSSASEIDALILTGQAAGQDDPLLRAIAASEGS